MRYLTRKNKFSMLECRGVDVKHNLFFIISALAVIVGCKSNPNKAEKIETQMDKSQSVSGNQIVGLKSGEMVVLDKMEVAEKLRDLQNTVYSLEDKVYGTRKLGSLGLYGELKSCKRKHSSRQFGGSGTMVWTEPLDRVTDKEEELKIGLDEKQALVGVSEEYLRDRLKRFASYKLILQKRSDEFQEKIEACKVELLNKELDEAASTKVMVQESPKASADRQNIHLFMCEFVKPGASLQTFMLNVFAKGWLSLTDYKMEQSLAAATLKDSKGNSQSNVLLFNGWKLAFDKGSVTIGELLKEGKDAQLVAWTFDRKGDVAQAEKCLPAGEGVWNP
jgi:hypothetical protein